MKILLALDAISAGSSVVQEAAARPWLAGSTICLLHAIDPYPFVRAPQLLESARARARQQLQVASDPLRAAGIAVETEIILGSPRRVISAFAREWQADLIMVGSHGAGNVTRLVLGSTAQSVLRHAPCSVEVVRPLPERGNLRKNGNMKILVPTDGSEFSTAALRSIARRPWPAGSQVKVISVPEFILLKEFSYLDTENIAAKDWGAASVDDARLCARAGAEVLYGRSLEVTVEVPAEEDRPQQVILNVAERWQPDLIVLGSHGRTGFDRLIMGSVAEAVALQAQCSVEIVREAHPD